MDNNLQTIKSIYSQGERFDEMRVYKDRKLKIWEEEVSGKFPINSKVLVIGCGKGREAFCLDEKGFHVTGIDISETAIETARQVAKINQLNIDFRISNGFDLPFSDAEFDIVIIWAQTFGLFYGKINQLRILKECMRVLKNGGILSISGHDKEFLQVNYPQCLKDGYFYPFTESELHYVMFTNKDLSVCVEEAGFHVIGCERGMAYTKEDGTILHCECRK